MDLLSTLPFIRPVWNWIKGRLGLNCEDDVAIFRKLDAIADEPLLDTILNRSIFTHNFQFEEYDALQKFIETLQRTESQYLDPTINLRARELAWEMGRLLLIVDRNFRIVPAGHLKFRPERIDPEEFKAEWVELNEMLEKTWIAFETYRQAVKRRLKV